MNYNNMQYFCAVADEKSFTLAAKKLFVSQQVLSNHIQKLEEELGLRLFERTQPLQLTEAGELLYSEGKILLAQMAKTDRRMLNLKEPGREELIIGITTSRGAITLADILPDFLKKWPDTAIRLVEGNTAQINEALLNGTTDLNVGYRIGEPDTVCEELIYRDRLVCAVPYDFLWQYLKRRKEDLAPASLQSIDVFSECPFIAMNDDTWLGEEFRACCKSASVEPDILLKTASMSTLVALCNAGLGAIVLPEFSSAAGWCSGSRGIGGTAC